MDGERAVTKGIKTRNGVLGDGSGLRRRMSFGTVIFYYVTLRFKEAILMSGIVMIESICRSSSDRYGASMWAFVQGFNIIFRRRPWVR